MALLVGEGLGCGVWEGLLRFRFMLFWESCGSKVLDVDGEATLSKWCLSLLRTGANPYCGPWNCCVVCCVEGGLRHTSAKWCILRQFAHWVLYEGQDVLLKHDLPQPLHLRPCGNCGLGCRCCWLNGGLVFGPFCHCPCPHWFWNCPFCHCGWLCRHWFCGRGCHCFWKRGCCCGPDPILCADAMADTSCFIVCCSCAATAAQISFTEMFAVGFSIAHSNSAFARASACLNSWNVLGSFDMMRCLNFASSPFTVNCTL